jgi:hypothetical protein
MEETTISNAWTTVGVTLKFAAKMRIARYFKVFNNLDRGNDMMRETANPAKMIIFID